MRKSSAVLLLFVGLCLSVSAWARPKRYDVSLDKAVQAGSTQLSAGKYQVEPTDNAMVFYQRNKEVAKIDVTTQDVANKAEGTSVGITGDNLAWVQFEGSKKKLVVKTN